MLEINNLKFAYKDNPVLKGINVSADAGQCLFLLGKNGAGKTTLFRCVLGMLSGYQGEIYLDDTNTVNLTIRELARKVAYIPQAHTPMFNFTVFETVLMGTDLVRDKFKALGKVQRDIAWEKLALMNITHLAERGYAEISGGERQLALIARALAQQTRVLVMDEPTANLDYGNQLLVMRQVRELVKQGYLVILSTHNPEHALLFADMVLVLKDGVTAMYGKPEDVLDPEMIKNIYGVSVELHRVNTQNGSVPVFVPYLHAVSARRDISL